ncbi:MAG: ABC transporter permease [Candidatus Falkowbacteria bacterium]|nr:ABC transporter permease [Candidatus Falkowbacteria bacterium]
MTIISSVKNSLRLMLANKMRTSLTLLGLIIGITTVIIVFSAGEGIRGLVMGQVESFGTDAINTEVKVPNNKKGQASDSQSSNALATGVQITTMTLSDMADINRLPNIITSYAGVLSQEQASYGNEVRKAFIYGVGSTYLDVDKTEIAEGRFYTAAEENSLAPVIVLGSSIKDKLFGNSDAIGKSVRLRQERFTVIGIAKPKGAVMFMNFDDFIYMPTKTLQKKLMGIDYVSFIISKVSDTSRSDVTAEDIKDLLRRNHDISDPERDDFRVTTMAEAMATLNTITNALTFLLLAIVMISLVVGGVGIMNVMYVSVTERTMEIGLRKAVGATSSNIMQQFLIESILLTILGGVVGCILGSVVAYLISLAAGAFGITWAFSIPIRAFVVAISFSAFFGIVFGVTPARAAAKLDPIEALRSE